MITYYYFINNNKLKFLKSMVKLIGFIVSILLIGVIFLRTPKESVGLSSFATKSDILGSPSSAERFLNILTAVGIFIYFSVALTLNLMS